MGSIKYKKILPGLLRTHMEAPVGQTIAAYGANRGSVSIEASLCFPLFLFVMLFFIGAAETYQVRATVYEAAVETAEYMSEYAYLNDSMDIGAVGDAASMGVAALRFVEYVDDDALLEKYIVGGKRGVSFLGSAFPDDDGYVDLRVSYYIRLYIPFLGAKGRLCSEHIRQRAYLGYRGTAKDGEEDDPYVYVAENGVVYHVSRGCTYLLPDIHNRTLKGAVKAGYTACEYCGSGAVGTVYVTPEGEKYHSDRACSRLRRTVERKRLSEVGLPPCSKCGG